MPSDTSPGAELSRRERQIMDVVFRLGRASASEIHERLPDPPSATAVRTMLRILEDKGHLKHEKDGPRHIYLPTVPRDSAQRSAAAHLLRTFFGGSLESALATLLDVGRGKLDGEERERLKRLIDDAAQEGR